MKSKLYIYIIILIGMSSLTSCITGKQKKYMQKDGVAQYQMTDFEQYRLCVNDEITYYLMTANQETQYFYNSGTQGANLNNSRYRIYEDGNVILPTIGPVRILGMTEREAEREITQKFKSVVSDAEVKVALVNNFFYVQGDRGKGQFFMYKENLNIFQALAMAGDISSTGDKEHIKIIRKGTDGIDVVKTFDLRSESIIESEYYYIKPNDVIYIPTNSNSFFRVDSVSSFMSLFVAPLSLLVLVLSMF
jgi:polysaccharide export outer membrane protein